MRLFAFYVVLSAGFFVLAGVLFAQHNTGIGWLDVANGFVWLANAHMRRTIIREDR